LSFVDPLNGWIIALYYDNDTEYYDIHYTDDGGETWTKQHINGEKRSLLFVDQDNGWATGNDVVFKTTNGGGVFDIQEVFNSFISIKLFPNPCSGTAFLRYQIPDPPVNGNSTRSTGGRTQYLISDLYSISGKKIKRLSDVEVMPGEYEMEIGMTGLPAGVYFCSTGSY